MDRTVPTRGNEEISLYVRTYYSLLRSSREVQIKTLIEAHTRMNSALHIEADTGTPDMAAFTYVILRLPAPIADSRLVVLGQSARVYAEHGYPEVESWQRVYSPGRRRYMFYNGEDTIAVYIASRSDIDDMIPALTAYQIERDKLFRILNKPAIMALLEENLDLPFTEENIKDLSELTGIPADDLDRLSRIWKDRLAANLLKIARNKLSLTVRLLAGSLADYRRATRQWWMNVDVQTPEIPFEDRPIYFVSSNAHSLANMLSGFALQQEPELVEYIQKVGTPDLQREYADILERNVSSSRENFLYYVLKKYEDAASDITTKRVAHEEKFGLHRIPSHRSFDIEVQVIQLNKLRRESLDPRLHDPNLEKLAESEALIINIDFPLGMAAYQVLSEIARNIAQIRGVYIMGKAATLNGRIGDVMISSVVHDEHSLNTYLFRNCFSADDLAPLLVYGTVMDNQKAITAPGTFLQNDSYMSLFYSEGYTVMEMEAGPYLSSVYEMIRPQRHPRNEIVDLNAAPFPIGLLHYASDTPFSKGQNLGTQNLSYFGMDPTYATATAILKGIIREELGHLANG